MKEPKRAYRRHPINVEFLLRFYDAYCRTNNLTKVASVLELGVPNLLKKIEQSPSLQKAKVMADQIRSQQKSLSAYVFKSLSTEAQETWQKISAPETSIEQVQAIFSRKTKELRQQLFVHALVSSSFDLSSACRMVGMDRSGLEKWKHDLHFLQLLEEVQWHKKNFFENSLIGLVEERHPGAVLFVNRTVNADRGYSEKIQVEHSGVIGAGFSLEDLDLDMATRRVILEAIRKKREKPVGQPIAVTSGNSVGGNGVTGLAVQAIASNGKFLKGSGKKNNFLKKGPKPVGEPIELDLENEGMERNGHQDDGEDWG